MGAKPATEIQLLPLQIYIPFQNNALSTTAPLSLFSSSQNNQLLHNNPNSTPTLIEMSPPNRRQFLDSLKGLLSSGSYSDLVITCGVDVHHVHKAFVCPQSGFLRAALRFGGIESQESRINLPEDDPPIIKLLVQFFYEGRYDTGPPPLEDEPLRTDSSRSSTGSLDLPIDTMAK